jgi:hypothetical protein
MATQTLIPAANLSPPPGRARRYSHSKSWKNYAPGEVIQIVGSHAWSGHRAQVIHLKLAPPGPLRDCYGVCLLVRIVDLPDDLPECLMPETALFDRCHARKAGWKPEASDPVRHEWPGPDWRHAWVP